MPKPEGYEHSGVWSWARVPRTCIQDTLLCIAWHNCGKASSSQHTANKQRFCSALKGHDIQINIGWRSLTDPQNLFQLSAREKKATPEALSIARCFSPLLFRARSRWEACFSFRVKTSCPWRQLVKRWYLLPWSTQPGLSSPPGDGEICASLNREMRFLRCSAWDFRVYHRYFSSPRGEHRLWHSREDDSTNPFLISSLRKLVHRQFLDLLYFSSLLFYYQLAAQNSR